MLTVFVISKIYIMYRVLVLVTVFVVAAWAVDEEDMKKCARILHPSAHHCCKDTRPHKPPPMDHDEVKECMQLPGRGPSCEREICFANKRGIASSDGKIDKAALQAAIEKDLADNPELVKLMVDNCVNGDLSKFGKADMCDLMKLKICKDVQFAFSCPEWDNEGPCAGVKDLAEECAQKFA